jgi:ribonuclease Z
MPTLSFLGTGSGHPAADRFFSSTVLHFGELHFLVDVGEPCVHLLRDRGNLLMEISSVLITHGHVDHVGGLPALLQGCMLLGRTGLLRICLPAEMIGPLRAWTSALYLTEEGLGFPLEWVAWTPGESVSLGGEVTVTPHANSHLETCYRKLPGSDPSRPCHSYSLEVIAGNFRGVFSGDLSSASELKSLMEKPTTVLVSELSHFTADKLVEVLAGVPLQALCLVHLSEENHLNRSGLQVHFEDLLGQVGDVFLPEDGNVLDF